ncbi:hypothetical protein [Labrenzia sp. DG1229]|uniref:hypothetical protein n=1 Tax=Labrenzia sp. DG1229 TaxID=681847 RepID=UPI0012EB5EEE|nr:hypothetical protein [Labrenzia sp. DG1229]
MARDRRRRSSRHKNAANLSLIFAAAIIILACIAAVGGFFYWKITAVDRPELLASTLCPVDGPYETTVVLIDSSDSIPDVGRQQIEQYLNDLADDLADYGLLELRILEPETPGGRIAFSKCNPGNGANLSVLTANPEMARRKWASSFREPLREALISSLSPSEANSSPILETIQRIAVTHFTGKKAEHRTNRLIIVSDMLEHGQDYSHYRDGTSYTRYQSSPAHRKFSTDLSGTAVSIKYIERLNSPVSSGAHMEFWAEWIQSNDGWLFSAEKLQGAG